MNYTTHRNLYIEELGDKFSFVFVVLVFLDVV